MPEKVKLYVTGRLFSGVYFLLPTRDINAANVKIILCVILEEIKVWKQADIFQHMFII